MMECEPKLRPYRGYITVSSVESCQRKIIVTGTTFSHTEVISRRNAIRGLLGAHYYCKMMFDVRCQDLILTTGTADNNSQLCRAKVTDHGLLDEAVTVFLVDEGKTVIRELRHLYQCPAEFSERKFPAIYKQYILADVYPVEDNWSSDKISWLQANLENREVEAVFRDMYQNVSYISPLDIEGVPLIVTLLAIGNVVTEKFSGLKFSSEKISSEADKIAAQSPFLTYSIMKIPLNSYEQCFVLNVEKGPWRFCLQFEQQREMLTQVNNKLQMYMHSKRLVKVYPKVGGTVVCEFMNHLYRGLVLKIKNQEVRVYCVDFGITLSKTSDEIWLLPEELLEIPVLTYTCCLYGLPDIPDGEISEEFSRLITDCPLIGRVIKYNQDLTTVSLFLNSLSLLSAPVQYDETVLPDKCKAVISYINEGSGTIYLQLVQNLKELKAMQEELQTHSIFKPLDHLVRKGLPCLALYPEDGLWYRGIVIDPGDPLMVQYVDHGNEGIVPAKFVKKLDLGMLKRLPAQAIPCILNSVTRKPLKRQDIHEVIGDDSVNVSLVDQTVVMVGDKNIKAYIVEMSNSTSVSVNKCLNQVESSKRICSYGIQEHNVVSDEVDEKGNSSLTSYTTNSNYRSSMKPPGIILLPHTKKECRLSWVESPSNFYVTLVENELTLEALRKALKAAFIDDKQDKFINVQQGWMVAVYGKDKLWHRALVLSCSGYSINLLLIDIGMQTTANIHELRQLPASVLTAPVQATKCSLVDESLYWNDNQAWDNLQMMSKILVEFVFFTGEEWKVMFHSELVCPVEEAQIPLKDNVAVKDNKIIGRMYKGKTDRLFNFLTKSNVQNHSEQSDWQEGRKKSESRRVGSFKVGREETRKREPLNSVKWESGLENKINIKKENEFDLEKKNISNWRKGSESVYSVDLENTNKGQRTGCSIGPIRAKPSYRLPRSPGTEVVKSRIGNTPLQPNKPLEHPSELNKVSNNTNRLIQNPITSETIIWDDKNRTESKTFATARKLMGKNDDFKTNDVFKGSEKDELDMVPEHKHWNEDDHTQYLTLVMPFGEPVDVVVTWILSPVKFYCQVNSSFTQTWKEKMEAAQVHYNSLLPEKGSSTFAKDQMVMALDTEGQWHRAKVLCVSGNNINVQFIDIGTIETANQMFPMKKEYAENIPAMAICIVIPDLKPRFGRVWPVEVNKSSKNFLRRVNQCVLERQCDRSLAYIASQVTADEENYEDYLINSGSAIKINNLLPVKGLTDVMQKVAVNTGSEVYLTHVEGNGIVWLQCKVDSDVVLEIEEKIKTLLVKSKAPAEIAVGMPCIVQSSQDSWWYRALVKNIYEERVEVLCIDYGNSEAVHFSRVLEIPEELRTIRALGCKCVLELPSSIVMQTFDWVALLESNYGQVLDVEVVGSCGEKSVVQLFNKGQNIACISSRPLQEIQLFHNVVEESSDLKGSNLLKKSCVSRKADSKGTADEFANKSELKHCVEDIESRNSDMQILHISDQCPKQVVDCLTKGTNWNSVEPSVAITSQFKDEMGGLLLKTVTRDVCEILQSKAVGHSYEDLSMQDNLEEESEHFSNASTKDFLKVPQASVDVISPKSCEESIISDEKSVEDSEKMVKEECVHTEEESDNDADIGKCSEKSVAQTMIQELNTDRSTCKLGVQNSDSKCHKEAQGKRGLMYINEREKPEEPEFEIEIKAAVAKPISSSPLWVKMENNKEKTCDQGEVSTLSSLEIETQESAVCRNQEVSMLQESFKNLKISDSKQLQDSQSECLKEISVVNTYHKPVCDGSLNSDILKKVSKNNLELQAKSEVNVTKSYDSISINYHPKFEKDCAAQELKSDEAETLTVCALHENANLASNFSDVTDEWETKGYNSEKKMEDCSLGPVSEVLVSQDINLSEVGKKKYKYEILEEKIIVEDIQLSSVGIKWKHCLPLLTERMSSAEENSDTLVASSKNAKAHQESANEQLSTSKTTSFENNVSGESFVKYDTNQLQRDAHRSRDYLYDERYPVVKTVPQDFKETCIPGERERKNVQEPPQLGIEDGLPENVITGSSTSKNLYVKSVFESKNVSNTYRESQIENDLGSCKLENTCGNFRCISDEKAEGNLADLCIEDKFQENTLHEESKTMNSNNNFNEINSASGNSSKAYTGMYKSLDVKDVLNYWQPKTASGKLFANYEYKISQKSNISKHFQVWDVTEYLTANNVCETLQKGDVSRNFEEKDAQKVKLASNLCKEEWDESKMKIEDAHEDLVKGSMPEKMLEEKCFESICSKNVRKDKPKVNMPEDSQERIKSENLEVQDVQENSEKINVQHSFIKNVFEEILNGALQKLEVTDVAAKTVNHSVFKELENNADTNSQVESSTERLQTLSVYDHKQVKDLPTKADIGNVLGLGQDENVPSDLQVINGLECIKNSCSDEQIKCLFIDLKVPKGQENSENEYIREKSKAVDITNSSVACDMIVDLQTVDARSYLPVCTLDSKNMHNDVTMEKMESLQRVTEEATGEHNQQFSGLKPRSPLTNGSAVYMSYFDDGNVWLQRECDKHTLSELSLKIVTSLDIMQAPASIQKGKICLAMSNEDHLWYRAKILEALDDYVLVHYIDYGNSEEISTEQIREIPASLLGEALSYRCILRAQAVTEASSLSPLLETYINKVLSVAFCDTEDMNTLTLKCDDQNIFKDLDVLELISNPTKAFNGESLEICQEPVHGCQVCSEQDCSEDGYKDPQYLVSSREASMLKRTQAPREKSSNCKGNELGKCSLKQTVLCDKASFTGEDTQFHEVKSKQKCLNIENEQTYNMHNSHEELCHINIEPNERDKNRGALCRQIQTEGGEPLSEGSSEVPDYSPIFMVVNKQRERNLANETTLSNIKVAPASFNSKENLCVKEKINKVVYGNYSDFMLRPSELKIEAFTSYKRHTVKSHLHAIEEVEESETIDMSELKVRPYRSLLVHVEEIPFCLWIQKEEDIDLAEFVRSSLEELGEEMELLDSPQVGELCVAFLHESCQRAQVIALTSHEATVHYMDHGKYGRVPLKKLYKLQQEFLDIPPLVSQVYLPVKVIPGKESGAVLAVAEAALHSVCVCFDLDQLTYIRDEMYTLVSTPWSGSLGDLLVRNELAWPVNWESKLGLHMASSVTKLIQEYINELCDDSERRDYCVTPL